MARPQKEGLDYFPHDCYASSDEKIEPLILLYGAKGYAFYFLHLEYIYRNKELEFDISDTETRAVIQQKLHISDDEYNQILQTALKKRCFELDYYNETGKLTSNGVKKRAAAVMNKREKMRADYESSKKESNTKKELNININKSKVKEKNCCISSPISAAETNQKPETRTRQSIPPTLEEVKAYCLERNNGIDAEHFIDYYKARNWKAGRDKMTDWQAAVRTWEHRRKEDKPEKQQPISQKNNFEERRYDEDFLNKLSNSGAR